MLQSGLGSVGFYHEGFSRIGKRVYFFIAGNARLSRDPLTIERPILGRSLLEPDLKVAW